MNGVGVGGIILSLLLAAWVISRQVKAHPVTVRGTLLPPFVLGVIGAIELGNAGHIDSIDLRWILIDLAVGLVSGVARSLTVSVYERDGVMWRVGNRWTVALWLLSIAARILISIIGGHQGAGQALSHVVLLTFGLSLATQFVMVAVRGRRLGVPFAPSDRRAGSRDAGAGDASLPRDRLRR